MSSQSSKHYTQEDRQTILRLKNEGKSSAEIAQQLGRTTVAIRHQIWKMKKNQNKYDFISQQESESDDRSDSSDTEQENSAPMHHYRQWNQSEVTQLQEFMNREVSVDDISKTFGRSCTSIKAKWQKIKALSHFPCPYRL